MNYLRMPRKFPTPTPATMHLLAILLTSVFVIIPHAEQAIAHGKGLYATQEAAEKRAKELNCSGTHENNGKWMPCQDEADLHRAMRRQ